jgi:hypothetical protein
MSFTYNQIKHITDKSGNEPIITHNDGYDHNGYNVYKNEKTGYTEIRYRDNGFNRIKTFISEEMAIKYIDKSKPKEYNRTITSIVKDTDEFYREERKSEYYRGIYESHYKVAIKEGNYIHHIDGDYRNNHPSNLIEVTTEEHGWLHSGKQEYGLRNCPREEILIHIQKWKEDRHYPNGYIHSHPYGDDDYYYSKLKTL